jgi:carbamoyltransferase-like protein
MSGTFPYQEFLSWMARIVQADRRRLVAMNETLPIGFPSVCILLAAQDTYCRSLSRSKTILNIMGCFESSSAFTGFGVLINTSFNLHGRTIVRTADDAITDFLDRGIDELYLEGYRITRAASADPQA